MNRSTEAGLLALDVGSSRVKLGWFPPRVACTSEARPSTLPIAASGLPHPESALAITHRDVPPGDLTREIERWLEPIAWQGSRCFVASVCPEVNRSIKELFGSQMRLLAHTDLPLDVRVDQPEQVGIDRLLCVVAANRLRRPGQIVVTISVGTAITVNLAAADGAFEGGAIFPGLGISAASLRVGTSTLPQLSASTIEAPPDPVGKSTSVAIKAGLYWGAVGAIRQLARLQLQSTPLRTKDIDQLQMFVTGGDAKLLVEHLDIDGIPARHVPHMVLAGIAITAEALS